MMLVGAVTAFVTLVITGSYFFAFFISLLSGVIMSGLFAVLVLFLMSNQIATGLALTIFGIGLSSMLGKEYIGSDTQITYDLVFSEANIFFGSNTRSWNVDRFSGVSNLNSKNADGSWNTVRWVCKKAEKKF